MCSPFRVGLGAAHAPSPDVRYGPPGLCSLDAACASASMPPLVSKAGSRSTGSPSLPPVAQVFNLCAFPVRIGIGVVKADRP